MALADLRILVDAMVRDDTGVIASGDRDGAIALAVVRYSEDRPLALVVDGVAPGGQRLTLPAEWQPDVSRLVAIESPVGEVPPAQISTEDWRLYRGAAGDEVQLQAAVAAGTTVRYRITVPHTLGETTDTMPLRDREAVAAWAAALLLDQLAALYAGHRDPTIQSDRVDWGSKSGDTAKRAASMRKRYLDHIGIEDRRAAPAGVVISHRDRDSRGQDRLLRRRRI